MMFSVRMRCLQVVLCLLTLVSVAYTADDDIWDECGLDLRKPTGLDKYIDVPFIKKVFRHFRPSYKPDMSMHFYLYTRRSKFCGEEIRMDDESLGRSHFDASAQTRILIHGWMSQSKGQFNRLIKTAYLSIGDFNVIVVDWSVLSANLNYYSVVKVVDDLGILLANFTQHLVNQAEADFDDIYLIGHSLGAQIAGSAGKHIRPYKFNTIFALDPAAPSFKENSIDDRIDATDATYVESIQTSVKSLGLWEPVGTASFYPNFGHYQKCFYYGCSHIRSYLFFAESLTSSAGFWGTHCYQKNLVARRCPEEGEQQKMGGEPSTPKEGVFYVKTNYFQPYAVGRR